MARIGTTKHRAVGSRVQRPQCLHVEWSMETLVDEAGEMPDANDEGFWPSLDRDAAGWIGDNPARSFEDQRADAKARYDAFAAGDLYFMRVRAVAWLMIPAGGTSFRLMTLHSAGLWGVESDASAEYLAEIFEDEKAALRREIEALGHAFTSGLMVEA